MVVFSGQVTQNREIKIRRFTMANAINHSSRNKQGRTNAKTVQNHGNRPSKKAQAILVAVIGAVAVILSALIGVFGPTLVSHVFSVTSTPVSGTSIVITPPPAVSPVGDIATGDKLYRTIILGGPSAWADD